MNQPDFFIFIILLICSFLDLRTGKIKNSLNLFFFSFSMSFLIFSHQLDWPSYIPFIYTLSLLFLFIFPLVWIGGLGSGDFKLLIALSPLISPEKFLSFLTHSLFWALIFIVLLSILRGKIKTLFFSTLSTMALPLNSEVKSSLFIPMTIPLLFAWLSLMNFDFSFFIFGGTK